MKHHQIVKNSVAEEFRNTPLSDQRLITRLMYIATILKNNPEKSIPEASPDWVTTKSIYQFLQMVE
jgi:hypothetical protein